MSNENFAELMEAPEEDTRYVLDGFVFYLDDGPVFPGEKDAQALPVIMAIGMASKDYMIELAYKVRSGTVSFAKNRLNPRIAPFYQQNLLTYPEGFHEFIDDVSLEELNSDEEQPGQDTASPDQEAQQESSGKE